MIMLKTHILKQLERSGSQSSVKGVSRIIKTKDKVLKSIWIAAVLALLAICLRSVHDVVANFFQYPTNTVIRSVLFTDEEFSRSSIKNNSTPDVTFCNLNPFRSDYLHIAQRENIPTLNDYLAEMEKLNKSQENTFNYFSDKFQSLVGYYQYIGHENAAKLSHTADSLLVDCKILVFGGFGRTSLPCNLERQIKRYLTSDYFSCYTVTFEPEVSLELADQGWIVGGVEVIVFLDNFAPTSDGIYMEKNSGIGLSAAVHQHGTIFVPETDSIPVAVGTESTVALALEVRERLPEPYGKCQHTDKQVWSIDGKQYKYTLVACFATCIQEAVKSSCGCHMGFYIPTTTRTNLTATPYCLDLKQPHSKIHDRSQCMIDTVKVNFRSCMKCSPECAEYIYHKDEFSAKWPRKSQQIPFYDQFIKGSHLEEKFTVYEKIKQLYEIGNETEAKQLLLETDLIENNFAKVSVQLASIDVSLVQDQIAVTLFDLLAKVGGTLNLYSGISCIIIVEIFEFLYNLLVMYGKNDTREETNKEKN